jgi:uncharacterized protein YbbC (DUF1343 family)
MAHIGFQEQSQGPVRTGLERLVTDERARLRGKRVALLGHHASFARAESGHRLVFAADALAAAGADVVRLFGPEHGLWGAAQDMIPVDGGQDPFTGRPVVSLYGNDKASLTPSPTVFEGLDAVIIDLQDVGSRYYTYVATAAYVVLAARAAGVQVLVCDRPNPLGGRVTGGRVDVGLRSFVGAFDVPQRHGMTLAELVQMVTGGAADVIAMSGWRRAMWFDDTGLPWFPPSPNMPTLGTATVYPGLCLVEGTNLSEGRGTTTPFEVIGAPFIRPFEFADALGSYDLKGVTFRPHVFEPTFQKWAGSACGGVQVIVTDRDVFEPVRLGLALLQTAFQLYPGQTLERRHVYEFEAERLAVDLLLGEAGCSQALRDGAPIESLTASFAAAEADFRAARAPFLLYDE